MTYLHNDVQTFEDAVMLTARQTGIIAPAIEKDFCCYDYYYLRNFHILYLKVTLL